MLLLQTCNSVVYVVMMGLVLGQSWMFISTTGIMLYAKVSPLYNVLCQCNVVVYMLNTLFTNILAGHCTLSHWSSLRYKISDLHLLQCLGYWDSN